MKALVVALMFFLMGCDMTPADIRTPMPSASPDMFGPSEARILRVEGPASGKVGQPITLNVTVEFVDTGLDVGKMVAEVDPELPLVTVSGTEVRTSTSPQPAVVSKRVQVQFIPSKPGAYKVVVKSQRYVGLPDPALTIEVAE